MMGRSASHNNHDNNNNDDDDEDDDDNVLSILKSLSRALRVNFHRRRSPHIWERPHVVLRK